MAGDFRVTRQYIYIAGNVIDPFQNNTNEGVLYANTNAMMDNVTGHQHSGIQGDGGPITAGSITITDPGGYFYSLILNTVLQEIGAELPPIGTILPFYDFGPVGPPPGLLGFNPIYYQYCDGSAFNFGTVHGVVVGIQTLPDLSGRALVGFGTDGGGDIDTAVWATAPVGNAGNTINIQHSHTVNSHTHGLANHTHDMGNHTHTVNSHTHGLANHTHTVSSIQFAICDIAVTAGAGTWNFYDNVGGSHTLATATNGAIGGLASSWDFGDLTARTYFGSAPPSTTSVPTPNTSDATSPGTSGPSTNTTSVPTPNTSDATSPGTDLQLSLTQSIQPISVRVRFIMRVH